MPTQDQTKTTELIAIFDAALRRAYINLQRGKEESLSSVANSFYTAFQGARDNLANDNLLPIVPGNDPHNVSHEDNSTLRIAIAGVYGFPTSQSNTERSPHSIQALKEMQAIASEIHQRGLCIFT